LASSFCRDFPPPFPAFVFLIEFPLRAVPHGAFVSPEVAILLTPYPSSVFLYWRDPRSIYPLPTLRVCLSLYLPLESHSRESTCVGLFLLPSLSEKASGSFTVLSLGQFPPHSPFAANTFNSPSNCFFCPPISLPCVSTKSPPCRGFLNPPSLPLLFRCLLGVRKLG